MSTQLIKIVLPEGDDDRILAAAKILVEKRLCHPVIIGEQEVVSSVMGVNDLYTIVMPDENYEHSVQQGSALVKAGKASGIVAGAATETSDVFRYYVKQIGAHDSVSRATSCFFMKKDDKNIIFADCGLNPSSDSVELAETAYLSTQFAKVVGIGEPKVSMLGFQTVGGKIHKSLDFVTQAAELTRKKYDISCEGPVQFDAALLPNVAAKKMSADTIVGGQSNIFIFPDLNSGNIGYKIAERIGGYQAIGPIFLGLNSPANDLSRGCSVEDIVEVVKITAAQVEQG